MTPDLTSLVYLREYLYKNYPTLTEYAKEVQIRLDQITEPLVEDLKKTLKGMKIGKDRTILDDEDKPDNSG